MKRTRSSAFAESEYSTSSESASSTGKDDTDADQDYAPPNKKRKQGTRHRVKLAPKAVAKTVPKKKQPALKKPRVPAKAAPAATTSAVAVAAASDNATPGKNAELASAISPRARLPPCNLGAVEFLTFFPLHIQWPELGLRLYRNGWSSLSIAKATLHARNKLSPKETKSDKSAVEKRRAANRHQVISNGKYFFNDADFTPTKYHNDMTPVTSYNASTYAPRETSKAVHLFSAKLVDIAKGVKEYPKNGDRGIVTKAIAYAVRKGRDDLTTADIPWLAVRFRWQQPEDAFGPDWDQNALKRIEARIEVSGNYRKERFEEAYEDE